jgi:hypothetical protein
MAISKVNALMNQVTSFISNQAQKGVEKASGENPEEGDENSGGVVRGDSVVHTGKSAACKISFSPASLDKNSILNETGQ